MITIDTVQKIKDLTADRGWSEYRLVKESGLAASTISNIFHRNTIPSIPTLEIICDAFGITLSQFFSNGEVFCLSKEQLSLLSGFSSITPAQREAILILLNSMQK